MSLEAEAQLIGTGFFTTTAGILVTAKHVIQDNIGEDGHDKGGIGVFHLCGSNKMIARPLVYSSLHNMYDLAVCETTRFETEEGQEFESMPLALTLEIPKVGAQIATHSYHEMNASFENEEGNPLHQAGFQFNGSFEMDREKEVEMKWRSRVTVGHIREHFPNGRDNVMLPFPCFESNTPIYGGTSGGPVFDEKGRVFAVNCTSVEGANMSYHASIAGILDLVICNTSLPGETEGRTRTIRELARLGCIGFDPKIR